jgi:hypothetical protein
VCENNKPKDKVKKEEAKLGRVIGRFSVDLDSCKINKSVLRFLYGVKKSFEYDPEVFCCVMENDSDSGVKTCVSPAGLVTAWSDNGTEKSIAKKLTTVLPVLFEAHRRYRIMQKI